MNKDFIKDAIEPFINEDVWAFLVERGGWIAGGALTSIITKSEVNDVDIYLPTKKDIFDFICEFRAIVHYSDKSVSFNVPGGIARQPLPLHQLITIAPYSSSEEIFQCFDFTMNMISYCPKTEVLDMHPDCLLHASQRYLCFNENTLFPFMSLSRVKKYEDRGYTISKPQLMKVAFACANKKVDSWEEVEEQLGGLYGSEILLDEYKEKEFTQELLMEFLSTTKKVYSSSPDWVTAGDEAKWLLAIVQSKIKPKAWLSSEKGYLYIEQGGKITLIKWDDEVKSYKQDKVMCQLTDVDLQDKSFKDYVGRYLFSEVEYKLYQKTRYLTGRSNNRGSAGPYTQFAKAIYTWDDEVGHHIGNSSDIKIRGTFLRNICPDEKINLDNGMEVLHESAYLDYVEERAIIDGN